MNENEEMETVVDYEEEYDFSDVDLSDEAETEEDGEGNQTDTDTETEETDSPGTDTDAEKSSETADEQKPEEELFPLKYNKETKSYTKSEVTELAQKGLNYDRILEQRDNYQKQVEDLQKFRTDNEDVVSLLETIAKASDMDVPKLLSAMRENMLVSSGLSREAAKERMRAEDAERKLAKSQAQKSENESKAAAEKRQKDDVDAFVKAYPDVKAETIPQEVWEAVRKGESLVSAYGRYDNKRLAAENKKLQEKIAAREQNEKNKQKSLGSMKSSSKETPKDPFLDAFDSDI